MTNHIVHACTDHIVYMSDYSYSAAAERVFSLLGNSFNSNQESALEYYIQASCYARNDWVVCGSIMEHYGWCVGALWVVCGSIRERNYRLKKKNYLSGPK